MKPFHELARTKGYWLTKIQNELYSCVDEYLEKNKLTRTQFADQLHVSKGYVSQILNGEFDHRLSKLIDLALAVGVVPNIKFQDAAEYIDNYLNGYDFCINEDNVTVTLVVNNIVSTPVQLQRSAAHDQLFVDNDTSAFYSLDPTAEYAF